MKSGTAQHQEMENQGAEEGRVWGGGVPSPLKEVSGEGLSSSKF